MNKVVKFKSEFVEPILKKEKTSTRRIFDDKNLKTGDPIDLVNKQTLQKFAEATITKIDLIPFEEMLKDQKNKKVAYLQYRDYYNRDIAPDEPVKIIYFDLK